MNWQIPENLSFEKAINLTQDLREEMATGKISPSEIQTRITELVKSENGARGFLVVYLTDDHAFADSTSQSVVSALKSSPEIVSELLVKNLAMSSAMAITHRRNKNEEMARGSDSVRQQTTHLIKALKLDLITEKLKQLRNCASDEEGSYTAFFQRWGYDEQQRQVIEKNVSEVLDK